MSQNKKTPEPENKSNPVLGWIAAFAVMSAIGVFAFTRGKTEVVPAPTTTAASPAPIAPETSKPAPAAQSMPVPVVEPPAVPQSAPAPVEHVHEHAHPPKTEASTPPPAAPIETPSPVSVVQQPEFRIPAHFENPEEAKPLSATLDPATVQAHARGAYEVARRKPLLLAQLPCFCYCDRFGHKSLHDCYVSNHAEECDICMREALEADRMDAEGMSPQEIRAVIVASHHPKS